jgi:uncharacterized protein
MNDVFADTSYFVALLSRMDRHFHRAQRLARDRRSTLITTSWVLAELGNVLRQPSRRTHYIELVVNLRRDESASILAADQADFDAGLVLFSQRPDKEWSLTDCISFVVMKRMGITDALTADRHFQQAGFRAMLLEGA